MSEIREAGRASSVPGKERWGEGGGRGGEGEGE